MYLKVSEAATLARVSRGRIYAAIRQGWFCPVPDVPYVCLRQKDVEAFRDREKPKGGRSKRACLNHQKETKPSPPLDVFA